MAANELFEKLEAAVKLAQQKELAAQEAERKASDAHKEYAVAFQTVEDLRAQLNQALGGLFSTPRVRQA